MTHPTEHNHPKASHRKPHHSLKHHGHSATEEDGKRCHPVILKTHPRLNDSLPDNRCKVLSDTCIRL